jgi:hypothetical protein
VTFGCLGVQENCTQYHSGRNTGPSIMHSEVP